MEGAAGTATHAVGARSFGKRRRPATKSSTKKRLGAHIAEDRPQPLSMEDKAREERAVVLFDKAAGQLQDDLTKLQNSLREQREAEVKCRKELNRWSSEHSDRLGQTELPGMRGDLGAAAAPVMLPGSHLNFLEWVPPGRALAGHALAGRKARLAQTGRVGKVLWAAWTSRHIGIRRTQIPRLNTGPDRVGACFLAGFCVCGEESIPLMIRLFIDSPRCYAIAKASFDDQGYRCTSPQFLHVVQF